MGQPARYFTDEDRKRHQPVHVVWEITLACDLKCQHCGSRAGHRRASELSTEECLDVVRQLARLGTREVTLIGGEAYLRKDWIEIVRAVREQGMNCTMQTGGFHLTEERIKRAAAAGLQAIGVSVDGLEELHDCLRGVKGSFAAAFRALDLLRAHGITTSVNTQITSKVVPQLRGLCELFIEAGAKNWQVQLTVAMGRAADHPEILLQPYQLLELMPLIAELFRTSAERGMLLQPGNNIGYFGPYEALWRGGGDDQVYWFGCNAGENTMGIEADGTIKGCPSLPTIRYAGGNVRDLSVADIWCVSPELTFNLRRAGEELWGYCRGCYYADTCRGGCSWLSHSLLGRPGNNPYCHHRALELNRQGLRERVVPIEPAPGLSFDHGRHALLLEMTDGQPVSTTHLSPFEFAENNRLSTQPNASSTGQTSGLVQISRAAKQSASAARPSAKAAGELRPTGPPLILCRACNRHVKQRTRACPFCGTNVKASARAYEKSLREARQACMELLEFLS